MRRSVSFLSEERRVKNCGMPPAAAWSQYVPRSGTPQFFTLHFSLLAYLMSNKRFPFSMVSRAISSVVMPLIWASFSAM